MDIECQKERATNHAESDFLCCMSTRGNSLSRLVLILFRLSFYKSKILFLLYLNISLCKVFVYMTVLMYVLKKWNYCHTKALALSLISVLIMEPNKCPYTVAK